MDDRIPSYVFLFNTSPNSHALHRHQFLPSLPSSSSSSSSTFFLFFYLFNFLIFFPLISLLVFLYPSSSFSSSYFCAAQVNPINHILSIILVSFFYFIDQQIER